MPRLQRIDIPQTVKVRKYEVDCEALCDLLRKHKATAGKSNKELSETLGVPVTKVEHWFRQDGCFAIPSAEIWYALKEELAIETTAFDESIMTFEERAGVYEKSQRCYFAEGIAPTLTSTSAGNEKIIVEVKDMPNDASVVAAAMRGRYNESGKVEQQIEVSDRECANTITSVQKDSLVSSNLRIRKLTPKECFRLMGFDDADYEKASAVNSNTQLYKQAGNSIGVPVVQHIMTALFDSGVLERA